MHLRVFGMATCLQGRLPMGPAESGFIPPQMTPPPQERLMRGGQTDRLRTGKRTKWEKKRDLTQGENERGRLSALKQHQALYSWVCHLKILRSLLIARRLKPNLGKQQDGAVENISETMFPVVKPNHKYIFCLFSLHSKHALSPE